MDKKRYFLEIFRKAKKRYGRYEKRLAAEGWDKDWKILIATIMSAQSRDETTILAAERLFSHYPSLESLSKAKYSSVFNLIKNINYNKTKAKNIIAASQYLIKNHQGRIPDTIEELVEIPGVGRKTANLVLSEIHKKDSICVDTHVHRISNALNLVKTKTPHQTEIALMQIAPRRYWSRINRLFVLWGKEVRGRDKNKLLEKLKE